MVYACIHTSLYYSGKLDFVSQVFCKKCASRFFYVRYFSYISTVIKDKGYMKDSRYPLGYQPKIDYWQYKMNKAIEQGDARGIAYASDRLVYFVGRQYGVPQVKSI